MKVLDVLGTGVKAVKAAIVKAVSAPPHRRDPFFSNDDRVAEINAAAADARGLGRWLPRRRGWLR